MSKTTKTQKTIAWFLIALAITMPIAFTYLMPEIKNNEVQQNSSLDFFVNIIKTSFASFCDAEKENCNLEIMGEFSFSSMIKNINPINLIQSASADDLKLGSCEVTNSEAYPPNSFCYFPSTLEQCLSPELFHLGEPLDKVEECVQGCCIDTSTGSCSITSKKACEFKIIPGQGVSQNHDGYFDGSPTCDIPDCATGCCDFENYASTSTKLTCDKLGGNFAPGVIGEDCTGSKGSVDYGCCVMAGTCKRSSESDCNEILNGRFFADLPGQPKFCSTLPGCEMCKSGKSTATKTCTEFDNNIHYVDSCGNIEGITEDGNCELNRKVCVKDNNGYKCGGDCNDGGTTRYNGESWCLYDVSPDAYSVDFNFNDGKIPIGVMGSRDFVRVCLNGNIITEPCADYRSQICVQTKDSANNRWNQGACVMNMWPQCLIIEDNETCKANSQCVWDDNAEKSLKEDGDGWNDNPNEVNKLKNVHEPYKNYSCLPRYPPGFPLSQSSEECDGLDKLTCKKNSNCFWDLGICSSNLNYFIATSTCGLVSYGTTVIHQGTGWCKGNCDAEMINFAQAMAKKCSALGDCGATLNILGKPTLKSSFKVTKTGQDKKELDVTKGGIELGGPNHGKWAWDFLETSFIEKSYFDSTSLEQGKGIKTNSKDGPTGETTFTDFTNDLGELYISQDELYSRLFEDINNAGESNVAKLLGEGAGMGIGALVTMSLLKILVITGSKVAMFGAALGPWGWVIMAAVVILAALIYTLFSYEKTWLFTFQCLPASPPLGGDYCTQCDKDSERPCSEYRCKSLGAACELINKGSSDQKCVAMQDDGNPPKIIDYVRASLPTGYLIDNFQAGPPNGGFTIKGPADGGCIKAWDKVSVAFITDKYSNCSYSEHPGVEFEAMARSIDSTQVKTHFLQLSFPDNLIGSGQKTIYIKCQDVFGHIFMSDYPVSFCSEIGPSLDQVEITGTNFDFYNKIPFGTTETGLQIHVDRPGQCRWSIEDMEYKNMPETTQCNAEQSTSGNYNCEARLTGIQQDLSPNKFFIRCNSTWGITNPRSFILELYPSEKLLIDSVSPTNGEEISGCEFQSEVKLQVVTSSGAEDGTATCYWSYDSNFRTSEEFKITDSSYHEHNITIDSQGQPTISKTVYILCTDPSGYSTTTSTTFTVIKDTQAPRITRIYREGGQLRITTNELARCAYKSSEKKNCDFKLDSLTTTKFEAAPSFDHYGDWIENGQWYVKCYDQCNNIGDCQTIYPEEL